MSVRDAPVPTQQTMEGRGRRRGGEGRGGEGREEGRGGREVRHSSCVGMHVAQPSMAYQALQQVPAAS